MRSEGFLGQKVYEVKRFIRSEGLLGQKVY